MWSAVSKNMVKSNEDGLPLKDLNIFGFFVGLLSCSFFDG